MPNISISRSSEINIPKKSEILSAYIDVLQHDFNNVRQPNLISNKSDINVSK